MHSLNDDWESAEFAAVLFPALAPLAATAAVVPFRPVAGGATVEDAVAADAVVVLPFEPFPAAAAAAPAAAAPPTAPAAAPFAAEPLLPFAAVAPLPPAPPAAPPFFYNYRDQDGKMSI